jgi:hypothetical protein
MFHRRFLMELCALESGKTLIEKWSSLTGPLRKKVAVT